jgi:hypothetical protein
VVSLAIRSTNCLAPPPGTRAYCVEPHHRCPGDRRIRAARGNAAADEAADTEMKHVLRLEERCLQGEPDDERRTEIDRRGANEVELLGSDRLVPHLHQEREGRRGN